MLGCSPSHQKPTERVFYLSPEFKKTQGTYIKLREQFKELDEEGKLKMCEELDKGRGNIHGWYDALNPEYNLSYDHEEIVEWFREEGFKNIKVMPTSSININGQL